MIEQRILSEKEKVLNYINNPVLVPGRNRMGCDENWYNPYFCIKETFSLKEVQLMTTKEVNDLVKLARTIGDALY